MAQQLDNAENTRAGLNTSKANLQTLTKRQDFILASRGLKHSCETMIVQINQNDLGIIRVGFLVALESLLLSVAEMRS